MDDSDGYTDGEGDSPPASTRKGSRSAAPQSPAPARRSKQTRLSARPSRAGSALSRGQSLDPDAFGGSTPAVSGGSGDEEEGEDEEEPADLLEDEMDPINSGAVTPALPAGDVPAPKKGKHAQFIKRKETKVVIKGQTYTIIDDEIQLDEDPRGEAKIDADGNLLGGRQWKINTFTSPLRKNPNKLFMLSIDAARAAGFRDSLYFFRRNPMVHKLSCTQAEKDKLIELGKLSANLKSRSVTMVSARNCFKVIGGVFVVNGRHVFDDYYEDRAIAAGHKPGEPAWIEQYDPDKDTGTLAGSKGGAPLGATGTGLNSLLGHPGKPRQPFGGSDRAPPRDELISSQVGGGIHAVFGGSGFQPFGKTWDPAAKKAKPAAHLTVENWMFEYAKYVAEMNRKLAVTRKMNLGQVQVGLDVVEREEDMWIEVEEEIDEDEEEDNEESEAKPSAAVVAASTSAVPLSSSLGEGVSSPAVVEPNVNATDSPLPFTSLSADVVPLSMDQNRTGTPSLVVASATGPRKRKLIKVYNPIRGIHDPETNIPHVFVSTQPTYSKFQQVDLVPHVFANDNESAWKGIEADLGVGVGRENGHVEVGEGESEPEKKRRRRAFEQAAAKAGLTTIEYVVDLEGAQRGEELLPGLWDFRPAETRGLSAW